MILSYIVQVYYCPNLEGTAPRWTYLLHVVCVFLYQTLDALDGKQARRTGSSSPLGELFDHGNFCFFYLFSLKSKTFFFSNKGVTP